MTISKAGRPTGKTGQAKVLDEKELIRVLNNIAGEKDNRKNNHAKRNTAIVIMSNYLGLRSKELAALKVGDVTGNDVIKDVLRLVAAYTKGAKHRDVSLENSKVIKALKEYLTERRNQDGIAFNLDAPLFRSQKGTAFSPNAMVRVLGDIYKKAGFDDASSHTGRRSLITKLAYAGIDLNSVRQIAGHSSISTTQRYIDDNPQKIAFILKSI
jgi:integrase/recombinase XerD